MSMDSAPKQTPWMFFSCLCCLFNIGCCIQSLRNGWRGVLTGGIWGKATLAKDILCPCELGTENQLKNTCNLSLHDQGWIYRTKCWVKMTAHLCSWSVWIARRTACAQCSVSEGWPALRVCKLCHPSEVLLHSNTGLTTSSCGGYRDS